MRLWTAQAISTFGARIARTGLPLAALMTIHAAPAQLGILAALTTAPAVLVSLYSGGFVDRTRRRPLMIYADLVRAGFLLLVPVLAWAKRLDMIELYVVAAFVGGASALFDIADHAYLPSLIRKADLVDANSKLTVTESVSEIGGPAVAGILVQLLTAPFAIGVNALTYLASAAFLGTIHDNEKMRAPRAREAWYKELGAGLDAILANPLVRPLLLMALLSPIFEGFFAALYSFYAINVLHLSATLLGITIGVGGIGALLGAGLSPVLCRVLGVGPTIAFCYTASAVSAFFVPLAGGSVFIAVTLLMLAQLFGDSLAVAAIVPAVSLRQTVLPSEVLGRTAALFRAGSGAMSVLGALFGGVAGVILGARTALFVGAGGIVAVTLIGVFSPLMSVREMPAGAV